MASVHLGRPLVRRSKCPPPARIHPIESRCLCPAGVAEPQAVGRLAAPGSQVLHVEISSPRRPTQGLDQRPVLQPEALHEPGQVQAADLAQQDGKESRSEAQASGTVATSVRVELFNDRTF